jgi:hypothetical protein
VELLRAVFAPDPEVVMYSPGAAGRVVGLEEIVAKAEGDWARSDSASLTYRRTSVSAAGTVAWAAVDADSTVEAGGQETTLPVHISFVLDERDGDGSSCTPTTRWPDRMLRAVGGSSLRLTPAGRHPRVVSSTSGA